MIFFLRNMKTDLYKNKSRTVYQVVRSKIIIKQLIFENTETVLEEFN